MEICQHCGMYMKPVINRVRMANSTKIKAEAMCEFCGQFIASGFEGEKWVKAAPITTNT